MRVKEHNLNFDLCISLQLPILAVSKHEKICGMFMLPNTFINFISFVKSSEGITMMRKEYKTKSNYEQMRNDYFCFIPWNRLNIFEILNHIIINQDVIYKN